MESLCRPGVSSLGRRARERRDSLEAVLTSSIKNKDNSTASESVPVIPKLQHVWSLTYAAVSTADAAEMH
ncbi:hypothetical protein F2Q68_00007331 [Brassica cretica]|uniref:Uncharacterized protein n=1 Tax=Brassica cretica TaxID=69181 RepID=A0A8S9KRK1_BRACR|nr:hypothetical protein F2Q68_00007331 [Brassica cretica]